MIESERPQFVALVEGLAAVFATEPTRALLAAYWIALSDLDIGAFEAAAKRALRECRFMPRPAELREWAGDVPVADRGALAWRVVTDTLEACGPYDTILFDDPTIHEALRVIGGYDRLCELDDDVLEAHESRRFIAAYAAAWRSPQRPAAAPIVGLFEAHNRRHGFLDHIPPVKAIATGLAPDPRPAQRLLADGDGE